MILGSIIYTLFYDANRLFGATQDFLRSRADNPSPWLDYNRGVGISLFPTALFCFVDYEQY
jgi:hypothetical protein